MNKKKLNLIENWDTCPNCQEKISNTDNLYTCLYCSNIKYNFYIDIQFNNLIANYYYKNFYIKYNISNNKIIIFDQKLKKIIYKENIFIQNIKYLLEFVYKFTSLKAFL